MIEREYSLLDKIIINVDQGLRAVTGTLLSAERENPANNSHENHLSKIEKTLIL